MSARILCVDDDPTILRQYEQSLGRSFPIDLVNSGAEALTIMAERGPYAVLIAGMDMPGMNGIELLCHAAERFPDTIRMMVTGNSGRQTALQAVNKGHVFQFLMKPCASELLLSAVQAATKQYHSVTAEKQLLQSTLNGSVKVLSDIIAMIEPESFGYGQKVRDYAQKLAGALGVSDTWELELAAMLAPIGFVAVPPVLVKKSRSDRADTLTGAERDILNRVPQIGYELLGQVPRLKNVATMVRYQRKNYDGSGFPMDSVSRSEIPLGSRILRVLTEIVESQARGMPLFKAVEVLRRWPNVYDPSIVEAAAGCFVANAGGLEGGVSVAELRAGQILLSDIVTKTDHVLIVAAGNKVTRIILEKVRNFAELGEIEEPIFVKEPESQ